MSTTSTPRSDDLSPIYPGFAPWLRLSTALELVLATTGLSDDEARTLICRAIYERAIEFRCKLGRPRSGGMRCPGRYFKGDAFHFFSETPPTEMDWTSSRPTKIWLVTREHIKPHGFFEIELIELYHADVISTLCGSQKPSSPPALGGTKAKAKARARPARACAERAVDALYPNGVPAQEQVPNAILCRRVGQWIKRQGLADPSDETILRAAGRRK